MVCYTDDIIQSNWRGNVNVVADEVKITVNSEYKRYHLCA
jgi:hypothetical protein